MSLGLVHGLALLSLFAIRSSQILETQVLPHITKHIVAYGNVPVALLGLYALFLYLVSPAAVQISSPTRFVLDRNVPLANLPLASRLYRAHDELAFYFPLFATSVLLNVVAKTDLGLSIFSALLAILSLAASYATTVLGIDTLGLFGATATQALLLGVGLGVFGKKGSSTWSRYHASYESLVRGYTGRLAAWLK